MKKPYLKIYKEISGFKVFIVDGEFIRDNIEEEFTNFGQHYMFNFIPENEFWIDKEYGEGDEYDYFIDHLLVENRLMKKGVDAHTACQEADKIEIRERNKDLLLKKEIYSEEKKEELVKKVRKRLLRKYSEKVKIWLVNGRLVRSIFFTDFTEGGHDKVYPFIPENEVWIDDDVNPKERKFILLHELHERNLMAKGWAYSLDDKREMISKHDAKSKIHKGAHEDSSRIEYFCRKHPDKLEIELRKEVKRE